MLLFMQRVGQIETVHVPFGMKRIGEDYPKYGNENLVQPRIGQMQETNADK